MKSKIEMTGQETSFTKIKKLIASGFTKEAILNLTEIINYKKMANPASERYEELGNTIIILNAKYSDVNNGIVKGNLDQEYVNIEKARIAESLLKITTSLKNEIGDSSLSNINNCSTGTTQSEKSTNLEKHQLKTVELTIDDDFDSYSEDDKQCLLRAIELLLEMENNLLIKKIRRGSIKISVDIPKEKYEFLLEEFKNGYLSKYKVVKIDDVSINPEPSPSLQKHSPSIPKEETPVIENEITTIRDESSIATKLKRLYELQLIDSEIDQINILKGELPIEVQDLEDEIVGLTTRMNRLASHVDDLKSEVSKYDGNIKDAGTLIEKYKTQMDNVKNNREYDALTKEIQMQELDIILAEKRIREANVQLSNKEETLVAAQERLDNKTKDLEMKKVELEKIIAKTEKDEEKLQKKRKKACKVIEARLLASYEKVRGSYRNGLAVATIDRKRCSGCFNPVPRATQQEMQLRKKMITCEHCGRLLVDENIHYVNSTEISQRRK